jgi:DNA uptake protein ComE-like DNA-binding protein
MTEARRMNASAPRQTNLAAATPPGFFLERQAAVSSTIAAGDAEMRERGHSMHSDASGGSLIALVYASLASASFAASPGPASAPATAGHPSVVSKASKKSAPATPVSLVDVNSASRAQLKTLPGIGDVEADRIISGRPYHSKADLAEKEVIATGVYLSLKNRIIAKQKPAPKGLAAGKAAAP